MTMLPRILALIPARGGSKGIPRKNIAPLLGRPLLSYSVAAAREATCVDRVLVSTDDAEIAAVATECGADVPFLRPAELATDTAAGLDVARHALDWLAENDGYVPDILVELQPVAPLRLASDIDRAVNLLRTSGADSVVGLVEADHPYYLRTLDGDVMRPFLPDTPEAFRRQDLPTVYRCNGAIIAVRAAVLREQRSFYGRDVRGYVMPPERSIDIDTPLDLRIAEALLRERANA
jgi:CMP-N-acetylneuraminic acid synthetase